ncbi:MAG TPA: DNA polymerase III subunit delta' [Ktedonobacterales bacterium]|jgi:DNA polymerase-3 subunit delta'
MKSVVGHHAAQHLLAREALSGQVSHAYLITGPEQIGKTTLALEFARLLQCQGRDAGSPEPCDACDSCRKVAASSHPDVRLVVRPADKRIMPVELVREVIHAANLAPSVGPWRIFILPEIERMAAASANALLKTLEEPPERVVLLLTCSEPEALLPTVVSRCQLVPTQPPTPNEIRQALVERWSIELQRAEQLAALSHGRIGWAIDAAQHPEIERARSESLARLVSLTGASRDERLRAAGTLASDTDAARDVIELWLFWWRDVVLAACGARNLASAGEARAEAERQGHALGVERAQSFLNALVAAREALEANANPQLTIEALLLDLPALPVSNAHR